MGTWGIGVFETDTACDFAGDMAEGGNPAFLEAALDHVLAIGGGYLEASDAAEALAAADIIARLNGNRGEQTAYTASIDDRSSEIATTTRSDGEGAPLRRSNPDRALRNAGALAGHGRVRRVETLG